MSEPARQDAVLAVAVGAAVTCVLAAHLTLAADGRAFAVTLLWVSAQTGSWLLVALAILVVTPWLQDGGRRRALLGYVSGALAAVALQPLLQDAGMRALAAAGVPPVFGAPRPWPEAVAGMVRAKLPALLMAYALLCVCAYLLAAQRRAAALATRNARLEAAARAAELQALQARIHPHFLFNALHSAVALVEDDPPAARTTLVRLADLLRLTLESSRHGEVTLREELRWVETYLALEKVRFEDRLVAETDVDPALLDRTVPVLLLQPLVENAVKHGVAASGSGARISIRARRRADSLLIEVETTLREAPALAAPGNGLGLDLTRSRLDLTYGPRARLEVDASGLRHVVAVTLPLGVP